MGLFSMVGDVLGTMHDMKELGKIQEVIEKAVEALIDSGKCPEQLTTAFTAIKNISKDAPQEESLGMMKNFVDALSSHADLFPEDITEKIEKYAHIVKDLEEKVSDLAKKTEK